MAFVEKVVAGAGVGRRGGGGEGISVYETV